MKLKFVLSLILLAGAAFAHAEGKQTCANAAQDQEKKQLESARVDAEVNGKKQQKAENVDSGSSNAQSEKGEG